MQPGSKPSNKTFTTFRSLEYSSFRYLWLGQLGQGMASWMEQVVRPLLILELTGSALQIGLIVTVTMVPQLVFGLIAGVIADRYNKRFILMVSQTITLLAHLILALLLLTGYIAVWHVYVTAFIVGVSLAFNAPARQSLIPRLVPHEILFNAISLNTMAVNIMRVLGTGLAGLLLIFFNYGEVYLLNAVIYVLVIWTTFKIKVIVSVTEASPEKLLKKPGTLFSDFIDGFRYVAHNPVLFYLVGLALLIFVFSMPYQQVFVPLLALDILDIGRSGAGWLLSFGGIGAIIGSLIVASVIQIRRRGLLQIFLLFSICLGMVMLAQSRWFVLSALAMVICGGISSAYIALNMSILLEKSSPEYHGRVVSLMSLDRGFVSLGSVLAGGLAQGLGPQFGLTVLAVALLTFTILMFIIFRRFRNEV